MQSRQAVLRNLAKYRADCKESKLIDRLHQVTSKSDPCHPWDRTEPRRNQDVSGSRLACQWPHQQKNNFLIKIIKTEATTCEYYNHLSSGRACPWHR